MYCNCGAHSDYLDGDVICHECGVGIGSIMKSRYDQMKIGVPKLDIDLAYKFIDYSDKDLKFDVAKIYAVNLDECEVWEFEVLKEVDDFLNDRDYDDGFECIIIIMNGSIYKNIEKKITYEYSY